MENDKTKIRDTVIAFALSILQVQLFSLDCIKKIVAFIPESYLELFEACFGITWWVAINFIVIRLFTAGLHRLKNKFPSISKFLNVIQKSKIVKIVSVILAIVVLAASVTQISNSYKDYDETIPSITITKPETYVIEMNQYEVPLVYHVNFDDETGIQKIYFDESYIDLGDCTANMVVTNDSENQYVISLSNIEGTVGEHSITIKEGAAIDVGGNASKAVTLDTYYLYSDITQVDITPPKVDVKLLDTPESDELVFEVCMTDDKALSSVYLVEKHVILKGFKADIQVEFSGANTRKIILSNITDNSEGEACNIIIAPGVAVDEWKNISESYISEEFYI